MPHSQQGGLGEEPAIVCTPDGFTTLRGPPCQGSYLNIGGETWSTSYLVRGENAATAMEVKSKMKLASLRPFPS